MTCATLSLVVNVSAEGPLVPVGRAGSILWCATFRKLFLRVPKDVNKRHGRCARQLYEFHHCNAITCSLRRVLKMSAWLSGVVHS